MLLRRPVAAGRFYPAQPEALDFEVTRWLNAGGAALNAKNSNTPEKGGFWAVMLPHAGYVFCGEVIGQTLAGLKLPSRLVILCPNHTGNGRMLSVWPDGKWLIPFGEINIDSKLANDLLLGDGGFEADTLAHLGEHSIEALLPFLKKMVPDLCITPVCVGSQNPLVLKKAGQALAHALKKPDNANVGIVVSSDMNHYENQRDTMAKDALALDRACAGDPDGLLRTVACENISMCGAGPLALALYAARELGSVNVELMAHETSGKASGDYDHTVGYAGLRLFIDASVEI